MLVAACSLWLTLRCQSVNPLQPRGPGPVERTWGVLLGVGSQRRCASGPSGAWPRGSHGAPPTAGAVKAGEFPTSCESGDNVLDPSALEDHHGPLPHNKTLFLGYAFLLTMATPSDKLANRQKLLDGAAGSSEEEEGETDLPCNLPKAGAQVALHVQVCVPSCPALPAVPLAPGRGAKTQTLLPGVCSPGQGEGDRGLPVARGIASRGRGVGRGVGRSRQSEVRVAAMCHERLECGLGGR